MDRKLIYKLPIDRDKVAGIIDSIPSKWSWIDGRLHLIDEQCGPVAHNTQLSISRFYPTQPTIVGAPDVTYDPYRSPSFQTAPKLNPIVPRIEDVIIEKKLFSGIIFDEAGFKTPFVEGNYVMMDTVKKLAQYFIKKGYIGWISAYSGYENNHKYDNPEVLRLSHENWLIELEWDERFGGSIRNLETIIKNFEKLGLNEIKE